MENKEINYYAHSVEGKPPAEWQGLEEHLKETARRAAEMARAFGCAEWGYLAGLWHDVGKFQGAFQKKLFGEKIKTEHSGAGGALACEYLKDSGIPLAFAIAGHHAGLANFVTSEEAQPTPLRERLKQNDAILVNIMPILSPCLKEPQALDFPSFLKMSETEVKKDRLRRSYEFWIRFLFSALVDADRLDTEAFLKPDIRRFRTGFQTIAELRKRLDDYIEEKTSKLARETKISQINVARRSVLSQCRDAAKSPPGLFSLTVPTGGGKTLSSMAFALKHAESNGLKRIIVVIPYTSIIEQNAAEYKRAFGSENVIEHHSAFELDSGRQGSDEESSLHQSLATENWDAPIIVTTSVQFFETLFSAHPSRCRKLHNIARSVIILDEVQTLPPGLLLPILEAIQELTTNYHCSIILSTATLPALVARSSFPQGLQSLKPIIPDANRLSRELNRVEYNWPTRDEVTEWDQLAQAISKEKQVLAVVHRRQDARDLANAVIKLTGQTAVFHLSALMCPAHRLNVIEQIRAILSSGSPCRVISTQLIEAGVDMDFPVVYRAMGGLDSIIQAAGRCNREGRPEKGKVIIFRAPSKPPPGTPKHGLEIMETMLQAGKPEPENLTYVDYYFRSLYFSENLDAHNIQRDRQEFNFATVGQNFHLIEDGFTKCIIVPYGDEPNIIRRLHNDGPSKEIFRSLQRYTVNVYPNAFQSLQASGALLEEVEGIFSLAPGFEHLYDGTTFGLVVGDEPPKPKPLIS